MGLIAKLGLKNLFQNKKTAFLSLISIALSVAMTTMVVAFAYGGYEHVKEDIYYSSPRGNIHYYDIKDHKVFLKEMEPYIESYTLETFNTYKMLGENDFDTVNTHLHVTEYIPNEDDLTYAKSNLHRRPLSNKDTILEGRFPNNNDEMFMSIKMKELYFPNLKLNDTIKLKRFISYNNESKNTEQTREVRVVGIQKNDHMSNASYVYQDDELGVTGIEIKVNKSVKKIKDFIKIVEQKELLEPSRDSSHPAYTLNVELNNIEGLDYKFSGTMITFIVIVFSIILILYMATVTMIYNAFNGKVQQNVHDYGLLRSVGASKKQIKRIIQIESYGLGLVGVLIGILVGRMLASLLAMYVNNSLTEFNQITGLIGDNIKLTPVLPKTAVIVSIILSMVLISIPIQSIIYKLFKQTSIEAIREQKRYTAIKKNRRMRSINKPVFGLAYRKVKSDKKTMKGVQRSITISLVIFLSLTNILYSAFGDNETINPNEYNVSIQNDRHESYEEVNEFNRQVERQYEESPKTINYYWSMLRITNLDLRDTEGNAIKTIDQESGDFSDIIDLIVFDDEAYKKIILDEHLPLNSQYIFYNSDEDSNEVYKIKKANQIVVGQKSEKDQSQLNVKTMTIDTVLTEVKSKSPVNELEQPAILMKQTDFEVQFSDFIKTMFISESRLNQRIYLNSDNPREFLSSLSKNIDADYSAYNEEGNQEFNIFMYGLIDDILRTSLMIVFIIVIINTISISLVELETRKGELSALRSVGMTSNDVNKMLYYELILNSVKPLFVSIAVSSAMVMIFTKLLQYFGSDVEFKYKIASVLQSLVFIMIFIFVNSIVVYHNQRNKSIVEDMKAI